MALYGSLQWGVARLSFHALQVLRLFLDDPKSEITGTDIMRASHLASGTVYPLLLRFERVGYLESNWEDADPSSLGRPRRRFYRLTPSGRSVVLDALRNLKLDGAFLPEVV